MPKAPTAEDTYNPFTGYTVDPKKVKHGTPTKRLKPVDYSKKSVPATGWSMFSARLAKPVAPADAVLATGDGKKKKKPKPPAKPLDEEETKKWREEHNVTVFGENCPAPMPTFEHIRDLTTDSVLHSFTRQGFTAPTTIQSQAWPMAFRHIDMVGIAKTGSGKTLAFMVPAISHMMTQEPLKKGDGPLSLVLAPTRELAQQIEEETQKVLPQEMSCLCIYGGAAKKLQLVPLSEGVHVVVATPGRLIDLLAAGQTNLLRTTYLVLDEADRMLDMGFEPQVRDICGQIRKDRQTMMFSATWPKEIQNLASEFMRDFIRIHVGSTELLANPDVTQHLVLTNESGKMEECAKIIARHEGCRVLIFTKMKRTVDDLERQLKRTGQIATVLGLHGDKEQRQREWILSKFKKQKDMTLVATDVAARGLDIKELEVVINYDMPMTLDDYVHRIGRTGRAGAKGDAYSLITKREPQLNPHAVAELIRLMEKANQTIPDWMTEWLKDRPDHGGEGGGKRTKEGMFTGPMPGYRPGTIQNRNGVPTFQYRASNRPMQQRRPPPGPSFDPMGGEGGDSSSSAAAAGGMSQRAKKRSRSEGGAAPAKKKSFFGVDV